MPHKRAKRSVREQSRKQQGSDRAPEKQALSNEAIPKSVARVLNAFQVQKDFQMRKRKLDDDSQNSRGDKRRKVADSDKGKKSTDTTRSSTKTTKSTLTIQPGESIQHFNRRVEDDMRPLVKSAVQSSLATMRNVRKEEMEAKALKKAKASKKKTAEPAEKPTPHISASPEPIPEKHAGRPKEFSTVSSSAPRRLNDIAQAPPEFKRLPRGAAVASQNATGSGKRDGVLSMAQKLMMEEEREKAIARYRQMKANKAKMGTGMGADERDRDGTDDG